MTARITPPLTVFHDGLCPFCRIEIGWLRRWDRGRGRLRFEDIASPDFDAGRYGYTRKQMMGRLYVYDGQGIWHVGVDGFRAIYTVMGLGWLVAITRWPGIRWVFEIVYACFVRHRSRLGRWLGAPACHGERCDVAEK